MRALVAAVALCLSATATAQPAVPFSPGMLIPSPLGVAITIGTWIYDANRQKIFYIEVIGEGRDVEESRKNGFRLAVEQVVGSIIASETQVENARVTRDEIISYASGYVTRYEIVQQLPSAIGARTVMKVWVARNPIANRLLNESRTAGQVDGAQAAVSFTSLVDERRTGDQLVATVLADYPVRAYDIEAGRSRVEFEPDRTATLIVPYRIRLNPDYVTSLSTALTATGQSGACRAAVTVAPAGLFSWSRTARYTDSVRYTQVVNRFVYQPAQLQMSLYAESGERLYQDLFAIRGLMPGQFNWTAPAIVRLDDRSSGCGQAVTINGAVWLHDNLLIQQISPDLLRRVARVEIRAI